MGFTLIIESILLGIALAMDAFSVSTANAMNQPCMKKPRMFGIAGTFAGFQIAMPLIGWLCVSTIAKQFEAFRPFIPWTALALLLFIGGKMLIEGIKNKDGGSGECEAKKVGFWALMVQGVATSIDALSVGFQMAELSPLEALAEALIIGAVTFGICMFGLFIGKKFGTMLSNKASILGGAILIAIGIEIFVKAWIEGSPLWLIN